MNRRARRTIMNFAVASAAANADAAVTLFFRLPMFGFASLIPLAQRQAEAARMVDEKAAAFVEGALLANMEAVRVASGLLTGRMQPHEIGSASVAIAAAGMRPAFRRVRDNARRLAKRDA